MVHENAVKIVTEAMRDVVFIVEANDHEYHALWAEWNRRVAWEQVNDGYFLTVGTIKRRPISVSIRYAIINGSKVAFYYGCSQLVDHKMIDDVMRSAFTKTHDNGSRWSHVNGMNFHNCINSLP